jgi:hypothetical protein
MERGVVEKLVRALEEWVGKQVAAEEKDVRRESPSPRKPTLVREERAMLKAKL